MEVLWGLAAMGKPTGNCSYQGNERLYQSDHDRRNGGGHSTGKIEAKELDGPLVGSASMVGIAIPRKASSSAGRRPTGWRDRKTGALLYCSTVKAVLQ